MMSWLNPAILSSLIVVVKVTMEDDIQLHLPTFENGHLKHGVCITLMNTEKNCLAYTTKLYTFCEIIQ